MTKVPEFTVRPAAPEDLSEIHAMVWELAEYEHLAHLCVSSAADLEAALFGPRPTAEVILGREDAQVVAFALFFHNYSTFLGRRGLYLEDLFVRPAYRRRGYARRLLAQLAQLALARNCGRFEWTVLDWNAPAIGFYQSLGAEVLPDWRITRVTGDALARLAASNPKEV
ncbi:MAG: GNAT family N-acetyltransferase [Betaproteobacteria bacterium]|nr:GNAT family N-acetyltransferase [Betaproteobacteria bacterium]